MKKQKINIKIKILNHLMFNGKKKTGEKILLKSFKELQKFSIKQSKKLLLLALISSTPVFKVYKIMNKKRKKKNVKELPIFISNKIIRASLAIKFFLANVRKKQLSFFHKEFNKELFLNLKNESFSIKIKNETQKQALIKKHLLFYYRW